MDEPAKTPASARGIAATEADAALQAALCARLWDTGLDMSEIALDVAQGRVTLRGAIGSPAHRDAVEACVRGCAGVGEIVNRIQVAPDRTGG